ncbi:hypothetical protein [Xenorhabdus nematophila]|uniref:hypothetical protein n=1 Tax=Xenorhabdus nematophila TaxID=628 RepID=UPI0005429926|nr:hypothetical protein [Xenorhabdus nematophila]CEF30697.1 hypothetical protein XNW1_2810004 [Xenorhabdus nematophila str. Websteri]CEF34293.1 hypothetical protein XNW1_940004 [Xenorhabdus nematophila str. Websteri]
MLKIGIKDLRPACWRTQFWVVEAHDGIIRAGRLPLGGIQIHVELPLIKSSKIETP